MGAEVLDVVFGLVRGWLDEGEEAVGVGGGDGVGGEEDVFDDLVGKGADGGFAVADGGVVEVDHALDLGDFGRLVERCGAFGDLDDLGGEGFAGVRRVGELHAVIEDVKELAKGFYVPWAVFVDVDFVGVIVGDYYIGKKLLFELHCATKDLVIRSDGRFETSHVKVQVLALHHAFDDIGKVILRSACKENAKSVLLLHTQFDQLDLGSISLCSDTVHHIILTISSFHHPFQALGSSFSMPSPVASKSALSCHQPPLRKASWFCK